MSSTSGASPTVQESVGGGEDAGVPRVGALVGAFGQGRVAARKMARLGQELANGNPTAHYWEGGKPGPDPEEGHEKATRRQGSWWRAWADWEAKRTGRKITASTAPGSDQHPPLDPAPGLYARDLPPS